MKFTASKIIVLVLIVSCVWLTTVRAEGIGFQARLFNPPSPVSYISEPDYQFSVALAPKTYEPLAVQLRYTTQVIRSSLKNNSITFETSITPNIKMVPVSVDAEKFMDYNLDRRERTRFNEIVFQNLTAAKQDKGRGGLSIGVALPARFEKLFGEGGGNLQVTGYRRISFSGRSSWTDGKSDLVSQSKFPSLNMEQQSQFDIIGTIGSKISVKVSQDSRTDIPLANRIQIRYKGDEDDILKSIEAGNTNLSLPNTKFVGYSSRIQGLFGLKTEAQVGNFSFTGIASQEKGSTESSSITATGEESAEYTRDYQYVEGRLFDLGYPIPDDTDPARTELGKYDSVANLFIYEYERDDRNGEALECKMYVDPKQPEYLPTMSDSLRMVELSDEEYEFYNDFNRGRHYVYFRSARYNDVALGVYMLVARKNSRNGPVVKIDTIGDLSGVVKVLKTLRPSPAKNKPNHKAWDLMWRNCYRIPKGLDISDIDIKIFKGLSGTEGKASNLSYQENNGNNEGYYLAILGLDQTNRDGKRIPDNLVDEDLVNIYRPDWGLLIFPSRTPFNSDTTYVDSFGQETTPLADKNKNMYNYDSEKVKTEDSKYYIQVSTKSRSSIIRLNRTNIIEGSEQVFLNGSPLVRGEDYTIQYDFGQITLLKEAALDPNAEIRISFEYAPFLVIQKKTLLGARAEYEWSKDFKIGSTILYKSDKAQERKPRVGQETAKMVVTDFDANFKLYPSFLTKAADGLPLVTTDKESQLSIEGELAQSRPNPNVEGVAYIDDFESSHDQLSLGLLRTTWKIAPPPNPENGFIDATPDNRGKMLWHNPRRQPDLGEVYNKQAKQHEGSISTLRLIYRPKNYTDSTASDTSWAGIIRYLGNTIDPDRARLFEIRCRGNKGKMHIDFGIMNEDVNGDGKAFNEDDILKNGVVDSLEDVGLDGMSDAEEQVFYGVDTPDPSGDNYYFFGEGRCPVSGDSCNVLASLNAEDYIDDPVYYEWLNGTEGNSDDIATSNKPDKEALSDFGFEERDAYFSFVIDLGDPLDKFLVQGSEWDVTDDGVYKPWKTYQIPIQDSAFLHNIIEADPNEPARWSNITHVRVWFESTDSINSPDTVISPDTVEIAAWNFIQSNWLDTVIYDEVTGFNSTTNFVVSTVSTEDGTFTAPAGVEPYYDQIEGVEEPQRGLRLRVDSLQFGDTCMATKNLITAESYTGYRDLEMYVTADRIAQDTLPVRFFFRMGRNEENYYEYRVDKILRRSGSDWREPNFVKIDFNDITAMKDSAYKRELTADSSGHYAFYGHPNLSEVLYFAVGIVNLDPHSKVTGDILLDELRVTDVRRDVGTAARVQVSGNMADLLTYSASYSYQDPYFRGLSAATRGGSQNNLGSGDTEKNFRYSMNLNFHKFLPLSWGANIPISYSQSKITSVPLLRNNSDIVLPEATREEEKTVNESRSFRISESFRKQGRDLLFGLLLNRQTFSFSYTRSKHRSVNRPYSLSENYNMKLTYDMGIPKAPTIPIFFWTKPIPLLKKTSESRLSTFPATWNWSGTYSRNISINDDIDNKRLTTIQRDFTGSINVGYNMFQNLKTNFSYSTRRDLTNLDLINIKFSPKETKLGLETSYNQSFSANYDPGLLTFLSSAFNYKASYLDNYERGSRTRKSDLKRSWGVTGNFDHNELFGKKGRSARSTRVTSVRQNVRGGVDLKEVKKGGGDPFYEPVLSVMRFMTGWIKPFSYKYDKSYSNSLPGMVRRPGFSYRFGFYDIPDVPVIGESRPPNSKEGEGYSLSSGFTLLGGIATDVRYQETITRDLVKQGTRYENVSTVWPDLGIRIQAFKTLPLLKGIVNKFIQVFAPRTGYSREIREDMNLDGNFTTSRTTTINYNPLLSVNFKLFRSLSLSSSYSITETNSEKYNQTNGSPQTDTRTTNKTFAFTSRYQFTSPHGIAIPLFGRLKFTSNVSIEINIKYNSNFSETSNSGGLYAMSSDKSDFSVSPNISYNFSQSIKGGISGRWQDTNDNYYNRKSHVRELKIWIEIRF